MNKSSTSISHRRRCGVRTGSLFWLIIAAIVFSDARAFSAAADAWKNEWEQTLAAAKKEGEIAFYGSNGYEKVFEIFQKRYPRSKSMP